MTGRNIRAALAADPGGGAGNGLGKLLEHGADPDGTGLTFDVDVDGIPGYTPLTLGVLHERVAARAAWLHRRGVRPRDPVAVYATTAPEHILTFFALTRLGAIPCLMNGNISADIAAEYIRRLRAVAVLADARHADLLAGHDTGVPLLGDVAEMGSGDPAAAPPHHRHHPDDPIAVTHSSGTTGVPKACVHTHRSLFAGTRALHLSLPIAQGVERVLSALPAPHTAGILMTEQALCKRTELLWLSQQSGGTILDAVERWRPTGVFGFAVTWSELARFDLSTRDLDSVALWFNTGDSAHEAHIRRLVVVGTRRTVTREGLRRVPGSVFIDGLGSTEMGHSIFHNTHTVDSDRYGRCIGKPHGFAEVAVLDDDGDEVPDGTVGHFGLRSPTLSPGYWNDSVNTFRTRRNGYFLTGDLIYRDTDGQYYHMDRAVDSVPLPGGGHVYTALSEERILMRCPDVRDCTVVSVRDGDEVVTDVLLLLDAAADPDVDRTVAVRAALGEPAAATLRRVVAVSDGEIPAGPTGKVRKFLLRERPLAELAASP